MKSHLLFIRGVTGALRLAKSYQAARELRPHYAVLGLTERCNLRCRACGVWKKPARAKDELSFEQTDALITQLKELGVEQVSLIEGEPLLRHDIVPIVRRLSALSMGSSLTTNALLLTPQLAKELVEAGLGEVRVSIDAPNEAHDRMRGCKNVFSQATRGVRYLSQARAQAGTRTLSIRLQALLTSESIPFLEDWPELLSELGVDGLNVAYPTFVPEAVDAQACLGEQALSSGRYVGFDRQLLIEPAQVSALRQRLFALQRAMSQRGQSLWISPDILLSRPADFVTGRVPVRTCWMLRNTLVINPYGELMPCSLLDKYSYGNVLQEPLQKLWGNARHQQLLALVGRGLAMCQHCRCHFSSNMTLDQQLRRKLAESSPWLFSLVARQVGHV